MLSVQYCKLNVPSVQWRNQNDNWGGGGGGGEYSYIRVHIPQKQLILKKLIKQNTNMGPPIILLATPLLRLQI
jgi:hypothetical protein